MEGTSMLRYLSNTSVLISGKSTKKTKRGNKEVSARSGRVASTTEKRISKMSFCFKWIVKTVIHPFKFKHLRYCVYFFDIILTGLTQFHA